MKTNILTTVKGGFNTSIDIILNTAHRVGDILDLSNIVKMVPEGTNYLDFFHAYVAFCSENANSKYYRVQSVTNTEAGCILNVVPL